MVYMRLTDRTTACWSPKGGEVKVTQRDMTGRALERVDYTRWRKKTITEFGTAKVE